MHKFVGDWVSAIGIGHDENSMSASDAVDGAKSAFKKKLQ
jgi:hypothetical protein